MAANTAVPFPTFPPNLLNPPSGRPATEVRFSRWNNANAEPFVRRRREQKEIEDDIRRHRRYDSVTRIAEDPAAAAAPPATPSEFKSWGTPSSPSRPSIPGKASKYSKPPPREPVDPRKPGAAAASHPAFRRSRIARAAAKLPLKAAAGRPEITIGENGVSYRVGDAPFEFQYSYTETPKVAPLALREPPVVPFGPSTMPRPWTGRAPLPPSKKKRPAFDSFRLPPPGKKGVKSVQAPGPFLAGSGPKYHAASREEILGEPLTKEEVKALINSCLKAKRQLNIGRDGLTHNMLDNIHAHWKRRRVCKIKCKGVCTVDMDNVRQQLEEKTGGKIIYSRGGVIFLFRGRNYNYKTRPRFPLMLWKPVPPVYPRLVQRAPEGLTLEEATQLRKRGRQVPPICKLGKNGVYYRLVKDVKEAFEECELVRINCQGMNKSDTRKIGAKLKDLVPCVLLSFEFEHILMWRGMDWKSSLPPPEGSGKETSQLSGAAEDTSVDSAELSVEVGEETSDLEGETESLDEDPQLSMLGETVAVVEDDPDPEEKEAQSPKDISGPCMPSSPNEGPAMMHHGITESAHREDKLEGRMRSPSEGLQVHDEGIPPVGVGLSTGGMKDPPNNASSSKMEAVDGELPMVPSEFQANLSSMEDCSHHADHQLLADSSALCTGISTNESVSTPELASPTKLEAESTSDGSECRQDGVSSRACLEGVTSLLRQAVDDGGAIVLGGDSLDANIVLERATELAKTAPPGPVFRRIMRRVPAEKVEGQDGEQDGKKDSEVEDVVATSGHQNGAERKSGRNRRREDAGGGFLEMRVPHGSLGVDELAKLLR